MSTVNSPKRGRTFANVTPRVFNSGVTVDIAKLPETEPIWIITGIRESINDYAVALAVEYL